MNITHDSLHQTWTTPDGEALEVSGDAWVMRGDLHSRLWRCRSPEQACVLASCLARVGCYDHGLVLGAWRHLSEQEQSADLDAVLLRLRRQLMSRGEREAARSLSIIPPALVPRGWDLR
jgi:hypothetical protein